MKFLYYLAAIGEPDFNTKIENLKTNLEYIYNSIEINFDIIVNCYDENINLYEIIKSFNFNFLNNIYVQNRKGLLCELWFNNEYNYIIENYDYILFILDDVKIKNIEIYSLIFLKNKYKIEFISPKVLNATWEYIKNEDYRDLHITNRVEIYCLLLTPNDFNKLLSINDIENPNIWGVDYLMTHFNFKTGIFHNNVVEHFLESKSNHEIANKQMIKMLNKYGYSSDGKFLEKHPTKIKEIITPKL